MSFTPPLRGNQIVTVHLPSVLNQVSFGVGGFIKKQRHFNNSWFFRFIFS
uniref:Uncharacterized protein n=1 Tax=Arsenophonus nasoniae TaxID=638 RepID=D2U0T7_9GAMM|nr:conserved hypothetical protein [Arsenophonus nasoniae]